MYFTEASGIQCESTPSVCTETLQMDGNLESEKQHDVLLHFDVLMERAFEPLNLVQPVENSALKQQHVVTPDCRIGI